MADQDLEFGDIVELTGTRARGRVLECGSDSMGRWVLVAVPDGGGNQRWRLERVHLHARAADARADEGAPEGGNVGGGS